ncbi:MAG: hypothetical protein H7A24_02080 [Leptospiraceae bacterium]|nr:hypothetical protein [Leptospiraceae bacterium]MCP5510638.1 hypothetical protein [Leptospiraceae bacterium]
MKILILFLGFTLFGNCASTYNASITNLRLKNVSPDMTSPVNTKFTVAYDVVADSPIPFLKGKSLPLKDVNIIISTEEINLFDVKLPSNTNSITLGEPIPLESSVSINEVKELAKALPQLLLKNEWVFRAKGSLKMDETNFPIEIEKPLESPLKKSLPTGLSDIFN